MYHDAIMSEGTLGALMQLAGLILKQDGGVKASERKYVINLLEKWLQSGSIENYLEIFDKYAGPVSAGRGEKDQKPINVKDSVQIFEICRKVVRVFDQEKKVTGIIRFYEMVYSDGHITPQRREVMHTIAKLLNISREEVESIEKFVGGHSPEEFEDPFILTLCGGEGQCRIGKQLTISGYEGFNIAFLRKESVETYFVKYISDQPLFLNGLPIDPMFIYVLGRGSTLKSLNGDVIYYSDVRAWFLAGTAYKLSYVVENLSYEFSDGVKAIDDISFSVDEGKLVGIMGASGSGKTTLLNLLCGVQKPSAGRVKVNGIELYGEKGMNNQLKGVMGYVPQNDMLIEDLTVYENLYYAARQSLADLSEEKIVSEVNRILSGLGLLEKKDLKVGSSYNKVISGGERKRLNIAISLIREPSIMFLDEPTSGLSSRDSELLIRVLRYLALKGKLIFSVIHQPSSEIFKMFDKVIILDQGGSMAYFGNPIDAVVYFRTLDSQINASQGECPTCGNVTPEAIFEIIEAQKIDGFGQYTEERKVSPQEWSQAFRRYHKMKSVTDVKELPHNNLKIPTIFEQMKIHFERNIKTKIANTQYLVITLLEAPILGLLLPFLIKYIADPDSSRYIFAENENIPVYIFMTVIVAIFLGMIISAEEIFKDRNILRRERYLNLSRGSYLSSKILILAIISAVQAFLFVITANFVLELHGLFLEYWLAYFVTSLAANMLGLIISSGFNSVITIYLVIPLLIIPMMVLSGAMFPYDKLNRKISHVDKVPLIAEFIPTKWTYEALMVAQFKNNRYSRIVYNIEGDTHYDLQKKISNADFNSVYRIPELKKALETCRLAYIDKKEGEERSYVTTVEPLMKLLVNEIGVMEQYDFIPTFDWKEFLSPEEFNTEVAGITLTYLNEAYDLFRNYSNKISDARDSFYMLNRDKVDYYQERYFNYKLEEVVTKYYEKNKLLVHDNSIVQNVDPIYLDPPIKRGPHFSAHLYAPNKYFFGLKIDTFTFNLVFVLFVNIILAFVLHFDLFAKAVRFFEIKRMRKNFTGHWFTIFLGIFAKHKDKIHI